MYLSLLHLNPRNRVVRRDLVDCRAMHRTLLRAFPTVPEESTKKARDQFDLLYRVEPGRRGDAQVLVQSAALPVWEHLHEWWGDDGYTLQDDAPKPLDAFHARIMAGQTLQYRVRVNPTRKIDTKTRPDGTKSNGQRVPLRTEEERIAWLRRKGVGESGDGRGGFDLLAVRAVPEVTSVRTVNDQVVGDWEGGDTRSRNLVFDSVLFEGHLLVTDADRLRETLRAGIGSGKAFGFGLLSVMPAR